MSAAWLGLLLPVLATVFVVVMILLFERRRSRRIEADLRRHPGDRGESRDRDAGPDGP